MYKDDWKDMPECESLVLGPSTAFLRELAAWYTGLDTAKYLTQPEYDASINKWKTKVGQSYEEWEKKGWILSEYLARAPRATCSPSRTPSAKYDARGWYHWYCRFWTGRRCADDERQIGRWSR